MESLVHWQNIEHFNTLPAKTPDDKERQLIQSLIKDEDQGTQPQSLHNQRTRPNKR